MIAQPLLFSILAGVGLIFFAILLPVLRVFLVPPATGRGLILAIFLIRCHLISLPRIFTGSLTFFLPEMALIRNSGIDRKQTPAIFATTFSGVTNPYA